MMKDLDFMASNKTILVVDDDMELSDGLRAVLEKQGHRVLQARDDLQVASVDEHLPWIEGCGANVLRSSQAGAGKLRWITQREPHSKSWEPCCPWCPVYRV